MANTNQTNLNLFIELSKCEQNEDFEKGHRLCNKILNVDPTNKKAKICKIICKIHLSQFEEALKEISKNHNEDIRDNLLFEKAYCEYSLNKTNECLKTLELIDDEDNRKKELKAQVLYKKELYTESYEVYVDLIKNVQDDFDQERSNNLYAAFANLKLNNQKVSINQLTLPEKTFEQYFNSACVELGNKNYEVAIKKLEQAENECKKTMENDDATDEEINRELNLIKAQMAFAYQKLGNDKKALEIYNQILKEKITDTYLLAIVNNNLVAINQSQNIFDSKKRMKIAMSEITKAKLFNFQKKVIFINNLLLLLNTNQKNLIREQLDEFKKNYQDDSIDSILIEVGLLLNEKKNQESFNLLKKTIEKYDADSNEKIILILTLAQLYLEQKDQKSAIDVLKSLGDFSYKLGIVSTIVGLEILSKNYQKAIEFLQSSINWIKKNSNNKNDLYVLFKETSDLMIKNNDAKNAIEMLEELKKSDPNDLKIIINLINAYSQVNLNKAKELAKELPQIEQLISEVDVENLESNSWSLRSKNVKKAPVNSSNKKSSKKDIVTTKIKRKRKRKIILPKNYDPNVKPDPERWLPRWQRSTYKKRKNDRKFNVGKGTQGSVGGLEPVVQQSPRNIGTSPMPNLTRQQRIQKKKKKGKR